MKATYKYGLSTLLKIIHIFLPISSKKKLAAWQCACSQFPEHLTVPRHNMAAPRVTSIAPGPTPSDFFFFSFSILHVGRNSCCHTILLQTRYVVGSDHRKKPFKRREGNAGAFRTVALRFFLPEPSKHPKLKTGFDLTALATRVYLKCVYRCENIIKLRHTVAACQTSTSL